MRSNILANLPDYDDIIGNVSDSGEVYFSDTFSKFLTDLATEVNGEDWRNVGETGQPSLLNSFEIVLDKVSFRRVGSVVFIRGLVRCPSGGSKDIFTLPSGYRPEQRMRFSTYGSFGALAESRRVDVSDAGAVRVVAGVANETVSIDICFSI